MTPFSLAGKVALVTGANSGIGQTIAVAMAQAGAHVIAAGRSSCAETVALTKGEELRIEMSDPMAAQEVFAARRIDILVNNAGTIRRSKALDVTEKDWDDVMDLNLKSVFFTAQAFAKAALPRGSGKIVNIASLLSFQGGVEVGAYTPAKHGVAGITKLLANELAAHGINVNAIAPGYIETPNTRPLHQDATRAEAIRARIPAGRWGRPEDIAQAAVFLAAPASDYVNGAVLNVDGGWLAR
ncbi:2-dehydro-3-deoxy-D-gluconate 5-dehydrogenase KduD [Paracoccus cavernae]|uniref:2-dehydro-3-deoxy-D-gluconate 5-dehydrogenase KduD n=1 Tax=Paracoccus cavernae TaxID=1571207 RepID=UPI0035F3E1DA